MESTTTRPSWDDWFIGLAEYVASRSKDPSTKCGAVIVRPDKTVASLGFNGFPRGISDDQSLLNERDMRLSRTIHAELNAILSAKEPLVGYTLYVWPFPTCSNCALAIIQAGIVRVVAPMASAELMERWGDSIKLANSLYFEAGVKYKWVHRLR